jgi:predicted nucleic-acid-binding protein
MLAVDTNIVVRFLKGDDVRQFRQVIDLFRREMVFVAKTVVLETEWVLRRAYREPPDKVAESLESLIGLPNVTCEDEAAIRQALAWHRSGMDFADAVHLTAAPTMGFVTFDRDMIKVGKRLGLQITAP